MLLSNDDVKLDGKNKAIVPMQYQYVLNRYGKKRSIMERNNNLRSLILQKVSDYTGLPEQLEQSNGNLFIVNGQAEKKDANFLRPFIIQ